MKRPLTLIPAGDETGIVLLDDILDALHVGEGDELILAETADGIFPRSAKT